MRLNVQTDYAIRVLVYLSKTPGSITSVSEIARHHAISVEHLRKVVQRIATAGWVETRRGRGGGVRLVVAPHTISVGDVVRHMEPVTALVACQDNPEHCKIAGACPARGPLARARAAFFATLDESPLVELTAEALPAHTS